MQNTLRHALDLPAGSDTLYVTGHKEAEWDFRRAEGTLTDWFQAEGFSVQSAECPDVTERGIPLPHAWFGFVRLGPVQDATDAKRRLNGAQLFPYKMVVDFKKQDAPAASPPDPAVATEVSTGTGRNSRLV